MNSFLIQASLIADVGDEESSIWIQIVVFLFLGFSWWVYSLVKDNRSKNKPRRRFGLPRKVINLRRGIVQEYIAKMKNARRSTNNLPQELILDSDTSGKAGLERLQNKLRAEKTRDLQSGMELLELDFLLSIVENTEASSRNDVTMRKLNFSELLRRKKLDHVNSKAIKVYAIDRARLYGKDIQCAAMGQLSERTMCMSGHKVFQPAFSPGGADRMVDVKQLS